MAIILLNLNRFSTIFTLHLAHVATLPCETLMSENERLTISYKEV